MKWLALFLVCILLIVAGRIIGDALDNTTWFSVGAMAAGIVYGYSYRAWG